MALFAVTEFGWDDLHQTTLTAAVLDGIRIGAIGSTLRDGQGSQGLVSDLLQLSILKPAAHAGYQVEEVAAFLGEYPPISPVPYEKWRWDMNTLSQV